MSKPISHETVDKLLGTVNKLCDENDGSSASDRLVKLAAEQGFTPDHIRLVCRGYNTGNIDATRMSGNTLQEKLAACELLNAEDIIAAVYPTESRFGKAAAENVVADIYSAKTKTPRSKVAACDASSSDNCDCGGTCEACKESKDAETKHATDRPERAVKTATEVDPLVGLLPTDMPDNKREARKLASEIAQIRQDVAAAERKAFIKLAEAKDIYRRVFDNDLTQLPWVHEVMTHKQGAAGGAITNVLAEEMLSQRQLNKYRNECDYRQQLVSGKTAAEIETPQDFMQGIINRSPFPVRDKHEAFGKLEECIDSYADWFKLSSEMPREIITRRRRIEKLTGRTTKVAMALPGMSKDETEDYLFEKRAFAMGGVLGGLTASSLSAMGKGKQQAGGPQGLNKDVLLARLKLNDPQHDAELKRLEAEMAINRLIADDSVIGNYTTEEVADAFDQLDQATPGITENPMLLQANIRRQLQGDITPFEADAAVQSADRVDKSQKMLPLLTVNAAGK